MSIATAATLATFTLEWVLHKILHRRLTIEAEPQSMETVDTEAPADASGATTETKGLAHSSRLEGLKNVVMSYTFETGIIFHSELSDLVVSAMLLNKHGILRPVVCWAVTVTVESMLVVLTPDSPYFACRYVYWHHTRYLKQCRHSSCPYDRFVLPSRQ